MKITFHLTKGRLDRRVEFPDGMVFQQSVAKGWYNLLANPFLDPARAIELQVARDALITQYAEDGVRLDSMTADAKLFEFDLRHILDRQTVLTRLS